MEVKLKIRFSPAKVKMDSRNYVESTIMELGIKLKIKASTRGSLTHLLVSIVASPSQFLLPVSQEKVGDKSVTSWPHTVTEHGVES